MQSMSIPSKKRLSNIEALRIIAMFLVLVVHANFFSLGSPSIDSFTNNSVFTLGQYFFESLSICCVNVFILISGWFGIHPSKKGFFNLIFQCLFFLFGIYFFCLIFGSADYSLKGYAKGIAECFVLLKWNWFIKAYILLYIMAPILNAFVEKVSKKDFAYLLVAFFSFQTIYSWISGAAVFFENGYSTISFMGLYLLARYVRIYPNRMVNCSCKIDIFIFCLGVLCLTAISYLLTVAAADIHPGLLMIADRMYSYVNPIVILMSVYLLLFFSKIPFYNKIVNWLGASSFAVFLLHTNPNVCKTYFCEHIILFNKQYDGAIFLLVVSAYLISIFLFAVLIDQIRLFIWKKFSDKF